MSETASEPAAADTPVPLSQATLNGDPSFLRAFCSELHAKVEAFLQEDVKTERLRSVQAQTRKSLAIIQEALDKYRSSSLTSTFLFSDTQADFSAYSLSSLSLSYNGGKDCLVLLILYLSLISHHPNLPSLLPAIYIPPMHPFNSVESFVASSSKHYHLSLTHIQHPSMRLGFTTYLEQYPGVKAILVGTRRTDPHGGDLSAFDKTDRGWPEFMRCHPVLEWHYAEIWAVGTRWCVKKV